MSGRRVKHLTIEDLTPTGSISSGYVQLRGTVKDGPAGTLGRWVGLELTIPEALELAVTIVSAIERSRRLESYRQERDAGGGIRRPGELFRAGFPGELRATFESALAAREARLEVDVALDGSVTMEPKTATPQDGS